MEEFQIEKTESEAKEFIEFIEQRQSDIEKYFPHYSEEDAENGYALLLKKEGKIIGAFVYQTKGQELHIDLDYLVPPLRDQGVGKEFFNQKKQEFKKMGFKTLVTLTNNLQHITYIEQVGFSQSDLHPDRFEMEIS